MSKSFFDLRSIIDLQFPQTRVIIRIDKEIRFCSSWKYVCSTVPHVVEYSQITEKEDSNF